MFSRPSKYASGHFLRALPSAYGRGGRINYPKSIVPRASQSWASTSAGSQKVPEDLYMTNNLETKIPMKQKITDLGHFIDRCELCMVTTAKGDPPVLVSRCMGVAGKERAGVCLIFHTNKVSTKTDHLAEDPRVNISFLDAKHGEWASVSGNASLVADKETVHKYYSPTLKPWFGDMGDGVHNGGPDDPRIGVIRVEVSQAAYAIVDEGMLGKNASFHEGDGRNVARINRLRKLEPEEIQKWRKEQSIDNERA